jgi:hypothetical protein
MKRNKIFGGKFGKLVIANSNVLLKYKKGFYNRGTLRKFHPLIMIG